MLAGLPSIRASRKLTVYLGLLRPSLRPNIRLLSGQSKTPWVHTRQDIALNHLDYDNVLAQLWHRSYVHSTDCESLGLCFVEEQKSV